jgi:hypothetical protein
MCLIHKNECTYKFMSVYIISCFAKKILLAILFLIYLRSWMGLGTVHGPAARKEAPSPPPTARKLVQAGASFLPAISAAKVNSPCEPGPPELETWAISGPASHNRNTSPAQTPVASPTRRLTRLLHAPNAAQASRLLLNNGTPSIGKREK